LNSSRRDVATALQPRERWTFTASFRRAPYMYALYTAIYIFIRQTKQKQHTDKNRQKDTHSGLKAK